MRKYRLKRTWWIFYARRLVCQRHDRSVGKSAFIYKGKLFGSRCSGSRKCDGKGDPVLDGRMRSDQRSPRNRNRSYRDGTIDRRGRSVPGGSVFCLASAYPCRIQRGKGDNMVFIFETMPLGEFTREQMQEKLYEELLRYSGENEVSERSFTDDCNTFLQMYVDSKEEKEDPEDKKRSVFARLRLIQKNYRGYRRERIVPERLPKEIVLLVLRRKILGKQGESIENLLTCENGPENYCHWTAFCSMNIWMNWKMMDVYGSTVPQD